MGSPTGDYIHTLMREREKLDPFKVAIPLTIKLLDSEIDRLMGRDSSQSSAYFGIFGQGGAPPTGGETVEKSEKIFFPKSEGSGRGFNFVGRMLGPGGSTMKNIESQCRCKIIIRGEGSMRNKVDEDKKKGQSGYEHLSEPLHVLITVHLPEKEADYYLSKARDIVNTLLVPPEAEDTLDPVKKNQLRELDMLKASHSRPTAMPANYGNPYMDAGYGNPYMDVPPPDYGYNYGISGSSVMPSAYYGQPPPSSRPPHKRSRPSH